MIYLPAGAMSLPQGSGRPEAKSVAPTVSPGVKSV